MTIPVDLSTDEMTTSTVETTEKMYRESMDAVLAHLDRLLENARQENREERQSSYR
jgi:hypothetical protein